MTLENIVHQARSSGDFQQLIDGIPYAKLLGLEFQRMGNDVLFTLPKNPDNIGNPILPAIHGGVIGGFMELAAFRLMRYATAAMQRHLDKGYDRVPLVVPLLFYHGEASPYPYSLNWLDEFDDPQLARQLYTEAFPLVDHHRT